TPEFSSEVMTSMPLYTHMLYNIQLIFHIKAAEDILEKLYDGFQNMDSFISLGRHEDLIRIDEINYITVEETDECKTKHSIYVPKESCEEDQLGIPYLLNWTYSIKKGIREWVKIPSIFIPKNRFINEENF